MNLRKRLPGIPVLMVGGLPDDSRLENRDIIQEFEIFPKPFQSAELLEKVTSVAQAPASTRFTGFPDSG